MHALFGILLYRTKPSPNLAEQICSFYFGCGSTHPYCAELDKVDMLSSQDRILQLKLNHVLKIFNENCPYYLKFDFTSFILHKCSTRGSSFNFVVPLARTLTKYRARFSFYNIAINHCKEDTLLREEKSNDEMN